MLSRKKITELLKHGISRKPLALHGTSVESLLQLLDDACLPTGRPDFAATRNYLYFITTKYGFEGTRFESKAPMYNKQCAFYHAKGYARINAMMQYIIDALVSAGINPAYAYKIYFNFEDGFEFRAPKEEMEKAEKLGDWWHKTRIQAKKRKGVILEVNKSILEFKLSKDPDGAGLRILCPNGLDIKYFSGIKLLGKEEERILENYLASR